MNVASVGLCCRVALQRDECRSSQHPARWESLPSTPKKQSSGPFRQLYRYPLYSTSAPAFKTLFLAFVLILFSLRF